MMVRTWRVMALSALVLSVLCRRVGGYFVSGLIQSSGCFEYITRFTFERTDDSGLLHQAALNVSFPKNMTTLCWVMFYEDLDSWAETEGQSCEERYWRAKDSGNIFPIEEDTYIDFGNQGQFSIDELRASFTNAYARTFYAGIVNMNETCLNLGGVNCDGPIMNVSYSIEFERAALQASFDETLLLPLYVTLSVAVMGVLFWSSWVGHKLFSENKLHLVYKVLLYAIQTGAVGIGCQVMHRIILQTGINFESIYPEEFYDEDSALYDKPYIPIMEMESFAELVNKPNIYNDMQQVLPPGKGVSWLDQDSQYLFLVSEWFMIVHMMMIAKGLFIVRRKLPPQGRLRLAVGLSAYLFVAIGIMAWLFNTFDASSEVWFYGPIGCGMSFVLRCLIALWFIASINHTRNKFLRKRRFFNKYLVVAGGWIITIPLVQLVLELTMGEYARKQVYATIQGCSLLSVQIAHLMLYHPDKKCNKGFPFHADMSQMDGVVTKQKDTTVKLESIAEDGVVVEKAVSIDKDRFATLNQYSLRIQERISRLSAAIKNCHEEYDDLSLVDEDNMTALEIQNDQESLRDDLTHGLLNRQNFRKPKPGVGNDTDNGKAEPWDQKSQTLSAKPQSGANGTTDGPVDLLTGNFSRQRANALDTAAPDERSEARKMRRATKERVSRKRNGGADDDDDDDEEIVRRSSRKKPQLKGEVKEPRAAVQSGRGNDHKNPRAAVQTGMGNEHKKPRPAVRSSEGSDDPAGDDDGLPSEVLSLEGGTPEAAAHATEQSRSRDDAEREQQDGGRDNDHDDDRRSSRRRRTRDKDKKKKKKKKRRQRIVEDDDDD